MDATRLITIQNSECDAKTEGGLSHPEAVGFFDKMKQESLNFSARWLSLIILPESSKTDVTLSYSMTAFIS